MKKKSDKKRTTTKNIVYICVGNGIAWVWCSYILAFLGKDQIAESLSQTAVTEIVGVAFGYFVKSLFENLSKNNIWPDKGEKKEEEVIIESPKVKGFGISDDEKGVG